jgi:hypothetical protein
MKKLILESRYPNVTTTFTPIDDYSGILMSNGEYVQVTLFKDCKKINSIDFEGGPMLYVGNELKDTKKKIKSIKACYYVELE